jgi:hypothetical protein
MGASAGLFESRTNFADVEKYTHFGEQLPFDRPANPHVPYISPPVWRIYLSMACREQAGGRSMKTIRMTGFLLAAGLAVGLGSGAAYAQDAGQDMKDAGHATKDAAVDTGHATKDAAKDTGHATKKVYHKTAHGTAVAADKTADGAKVVGHDTKVGAEDVGHGTKVAAKDTAHGTTVAAKDTAHGTKVAARDTAHGTKVAAKSTAHATENAGDAVAGKPETH